jgi:hypothetical protein
MTMPMITDRIGIAEAIELKADILERWLYQACRTKGKCSNFATIQ